jgi:hypothetical protein
VKTIEQRLSGTGQQKIASLPSANPENGPSAQLTALHRNRLR